MKKFILILSAICCFTAVAVWANTFDMTIPVKGKTAASEQLQRDSLFTIYSFALRIAPADCQNFSIADTKVVGKKQNGAWDEIWTIKACQKTALVPVKFTDNGTYAVNPMGVKYAK